MKIFKPKGRGRTTYAGAFCFKLRRPRKPATPFQVKAPSNGKRKAKAKSKTASFRRTGRKTKKAKKNHDMDDAQDSVLAEAQFLKTTLFHNHILGEVLPR